MPIQHKDVTGQRFGRLVALYPTGELDPKRSPIWHVKCDCGKEIDIPYAFLSRSQKSDYSALPDSSAT